MPIAPSRDLNLNLPPEGQAMLPALQAAYGSMVSSSASNGAINGRIAHKLAYAMNFTTVEVRFYHPNFEPPLVCYNPPQGEFQPNELGWQDQVTVKITHQYALLPGPGRLLAWIIRNPDGSLSNDTVAQSIQQAGGVYVYPLTAEATLGNEGEKSVLPYEITIE
jgi:protein involved in polysaccharide export with SLBB domain